jgi:hypothetical protein
MCRSGQPLKTCHLKRYLGTGHWVRTYTIDEATGDTLDTLLNYGFYFDLEFAHGLPPEDIQPVVMPLQPGAGITGEAIRSEYYSMQGRKMSLTHLRMSSSHGMVLLRKTIYSNGAVQTTPVIMSKNGIQKK